MTAGRQTVRTVDCGGRTVTYTLTRKRVKNLNLRVRPDGSVAVSAAQRVPAGCVDDFVRAKSPLIFRALDRMTAEKPPPRRYLTGEAVWYLGRPLRLEVERGRKAQGTVEGDILHLAVPDPEDPGSRERAFGRAWDALCRREFEEVLEELYPLVAPFGVARPPRGGPAHRARWGAAANPNRVVVLSSYLLAKPRAAVEYVVLHELCHFLHPDHSQAFYGLLASLMPDWRQRKALLR